MEQCRSELRVAEAEFDAGGNEAGWVAKVMADAIMDHEVDGVTLPWTSVVEVELATLRWVHRWNTKWLHEALGSATPEEIETEYYPTQPINTGP